MRKSQITKIRSKKSKTFIVFFIFCIMISTVLCQNSPAGTKNKHSVKQPDSNKEIVNTAHGMLQRKRYKELVKLLNKLPKGKQNYKTFYLLGQGYLYQKDYVNALPHFKKSIQMIETTTDTSHTEKAKVYSFLAFTYQKLKKYDIALRHHLKAANYLPNNPVAWTNLGNLYFKIKQYSKSEKAFQKAYKINAKHKTTLKGLGDIYFHSEQYNKAFIYYKKLLKHVPNSKDGYLGQGKTLLKLNKIAKGHEMLAKGYFLSKNFSQAIIYLEKIGNLHKKKDLLKLFISSLIKNKLYNRALSEIKIGKRVYPKDEEFIYDLAQLYFIQKNYKNSLKTSLKGLKHFPNSHILSVVAGNSYSSLGQKDKAIVYYYRTLKIKEDDVETRARLAQIYRDKNQKNHEYFHQGVVYYYGGDLVQAKEILSWVKDFPKKGELTYYKGMILLKKGKTEEAIKFFHRSIQEQQNLYMPYLSLAKAYQSINQSKKGAQVLKRFIKKYPNSLHISKVKNEYHQLKSKMR